MTIITTPLAWLSVAAFLASLVCHVDGWLGVVPAAGESVMLLHLGIFVLLGPLIFLANRTSPDLKRRGNFDHLLGELPRWVRTAGRVAFFYTLVNFILFLFQALEFPRNKVPFPLELRGFSGHWMFFYGAAAVGYIGLGRFLRKQRPALLR